MNYNRQDELKQMKCIPMEELLNNLGIKVKNCGLNYMFKAIWRNEKTASVSINHASDGAWIFFDHGTNEKGTNIDLVMKVTGWSYIQTVQWLRNNSSFFSFLKSQNYSIKDQNNDNNNTASTAKWTLLSNQPLNYLLELFKTERHLSETALNKSKIRELKVKHISKQTSFWIAGHKNIDEGWELFSPKLGGFKSCIAPKGISLIKGSDNKLIIAESIIDVISAKILLNIEADLLSLNSTKLSKRVRIALNKRGKAYDRIILCLDNDKVGIEATQLLITEISKMGSIEIFNYKYGNDPNSELISIHQTKQSIKRAVHK